jgi:hypothetical protein
MATKFAHRATCHENSHWQSAGGDARSAEEIIEGTVNTACMYHVSVTTFPSNFPRLIHSLLLETPCVVASTFAGRTAQYIYEHHFNSAPRFYHVAAFCKFIAKIGSVLKEHVNVASLALSLFLQHYP